MSTILPELNLEQLVRSLLYFFLISVFLNTLLLISIFVLSYVLKGSDLRAVWKGLFNFISPLNFSIFCNWFYCMILFNVLDITKQE